MTSGHLRKIDALVAEHVMGWRRRAFDHAILLDANNQPAESILAPLEFEPAHFFGRGAAFIHEVLPSYTTNIGLAWDVLTRFQEQYEISLECEVSYSYEGNPMPPIPVEHLRWVCMFREHYLTTIPGPAGIAPTAALAICQAALGAKGIEVPAESGPATNEGRKP
jgi:hypothetical protein